MMPAKKLDLSDFAPLKKKLCLVADALSKLDGEKLEKVNAALDSPEIQHSMIARRLREWTGSKVSEQTVGRHRSKECACD